MEEYKPILNEKQRLHILLKCVTERGFNDLILTYNDLVSYFKLNKIQNNKSTFLDLIYTA